jgi:hypothetical protein
MLKIKSFYMNKKKRSLNLIFYFLKYKRKKKYSKEEKIE